ncbi:MAG: hypothetical protein QGG40_08455, partial [Myxococcota bacterium]|nr:hypothetical protein [Myxococcota bacterium]
MTIRHHSLPLFTATLVTLALVGCGELPTDATSTDETDSSTATDIDSSTGDATTTSLVGMVLDPDGYPIANATITAS